MQKYLLGFIAVAMAVSFSAFTTAPVKGKSVLPTYVYWAYTGSGSTVGTYIGEFEQDSPALVSLSCPDNGNIECARGFDPEQFSESNPPTGLDINNEMKDTQKHN